MTGDIEKRFQESVARLKANPSKADQREYDWWDYEGFIAVAKQAEAVVAESGKDALQVRKYEGLAEDGHTPEVWFRVHDLSKAGKRVPAVWTFNLSHPCPPFCGGGG